MILMVDILKTSPGRYLFLFIFMCGNSKCTRIQKIKKFSGEVNWVHQALRIMKNSASKQYHVLNAPDNHSNQEVNVDVISNVMTFLTLRVKV